VRRPGGPPGPVLLMAVTLAAAWCGAGAQERAAAASAGAWPPDAPTLTIDVAACEPRDDGFYWGLGSESVRVLGMRAGACRLLVRSEMEMGVHDFDCRIPSAVGLWRLTPQRLPERLFRAAAREPDAPVSVGGGRCWPVWGGPLWQAPAWPPADVAGPR